jgi:DNA-binding winged helix-turn-helix (wHTH) protein
MLTTTVRDLVYATAAVLLTIAAAASYVPARRAAPAGSGRDHAPLATAGRYNSPVPAGARFAFGPFELDPAKRRLAASGEPVAISDRQIDVLVVLAEHASRIVSKDDLIQAAWKDVAVGDNSLEQVISSLRRLLGTHADGSAFIETVPRRGYRFTASVTRQASRESDAALDSLLAPFRAFVEGRAALESLESGQVSRAREVFEGIVRNSPEYASGHIGLANACVMQFETTRADPAPDIAALTLAAQHAREACRLDAQSGEAWATLAFVLDRTGNNLDARAAAGRAVVLEPDNWRHHFRLAFVTWGEERLRAAHRTLALLPDFPLAHWLAATVHVARQVLPEAERELEAGLASQAAASGSRFSSVALHWMLGLIHLARGEHELALDHFERELAHEGDGHLYARECAANTWYAIGALRLRQHRSTDAAAAFEQSLTRVNHHPLAHVGLAAAGSPRTAATAASSLPAARISTIDLALCDAAERALAGNLAEAADTLDRALATAPPGSAGWLLPIEPLLNVLTHTDAWARPLARLRSRAA